ncbi:MAG: NAD-dependent epimerase/dehydratase family protein, partial [Pseudomonadota bacterium]
MRKKALVTGAAGFIGKPLVQQLLARDWSVTGYDVKPKPQAPAVAACDWVQGSILDENSLKHAMAGCDTVFHLAARAHLFAKDPALFDQINRLGTQVVRGTAESSDVQHLIVTLSAV